MIFNVVKYNYKNKERNHKYNTKIIVDNGDIFYLNKRRRKTKIKNIIGIIHGPISTTWNFKYIKDINPKKCISIVSYERTWDFLFDKYSALKIFFHITRNFQNINNRNLHKYTKKYFIHANKQCKNLDYEDLNTTGNKLWYYMNIVIPWKNLNSMKLERMYNDECPICIEKLDKKNDEIVILDCLHGYHKQCIKDWLVNKTKCPMCNKSI